MHIYRLNISQEMINGKGTAQVLPSVLPKNAIIFRTIVKKYMIIMETMI